MTLALGDRFVGQEATVQNIMSEFPPSFIWSPKHSKHIHHRSLQDDQTINGE